MSMTALEIDTPQLSATQLVARLGSVPTITIPLVDGRVPSIDGVWHYLREPADFFGVPMPKPHELAAALARFVAKVWDGAGPELVEANVTIVEADGSPRILVTGSAVQPVCPGAVRVSGGFPAFPAHRSMDPWWRRMAARTTSRGDVDRLECWLNGHGFADDVSGGLPLIGALVFETGSGDSRRVVGVENPEPTSILDQLEQCGVITTFDRAETRPRDAERAWWVSPRYEIHPVAEIDGTQFCTDTDVIPSFTRRS